MRSISWLNRFVIDPLSVIWKKLNGALSVAVNKSVCKPKAVSLMTLMNNKLSPGQYAIHLESPHIFKLTKMLWFLTVTHSSLTVLKGSTLRSWEKATQPLDISLRVSWHQVSDPYHIKYK